MVLARVVDFETFCRGWCAQSITEGGEPGAHVKVLSQSLSEVDPELYDIIEKEKNRQYKVRRQAATKL